MSALVEDISPQWVAARMPGGANQLARLRTFTTRLNTTRALASGEVPLIRWLKAAIDLSAGAPQEEVFRRALERASADGMAPPAPGPAPAPSRDVDALPRSGSGLEIAIGEDDTLGVDFLHAGATVSRSVARLTVHRHFDGQPSVLAGNTPDVGNGTGWLLAPHLLITNHHVVNGRAPLEPPATEQDFALQAAATKVDFDYFAPNSKTVNTTAVGCVASDRTLDFALLRLPTDAPDRPPLRLRTAAIRKPQDRALRERINVLQHPDGDPMRLGFRNNFVVSASDERLSYLTDTAGGASGSPLCDDAWFVAGLHRGFATIEGGPVDVWGTAVRQENYGTPITRIMAHLQERHPELHAEVVTAQG